MAAKTANKIEEAIVRTESAGFSEYAELLNDAYLYGSTSSEIYFKLSGILNAMLQDPEVKDELLRSFLKKVKQDIDTIKNN